MLADFFMFACLTSLGGGLAVSEAQNAREIFLVGFVLSEAQDARGFFHVCMFDIFGSKIYYICQKHKMLAKLFSWVSRL